MNLVRNCALALFAALALLFLADIARADDPPTPRGNTERNNIIHMDGLSLWLKSRFSESELRELEPGALTLEPHYCGCYDKPKKHFPYSVVLLKTPKGDLVARPERREGSLSFTPLAVKTGDQYCELESEAPCYGAFSDPCDFTDFRYGPSLTAYFPSCMSDAAEPVQD